MPKFIDKIVECLKLTFNNFIATNTFTLHLFIHLCSINPYSKAIDGTDF